MQKTALLFSGYNQRAIIALCRCFAAAEQDIAIIASGPDDDIHSTDYARHVLFTREDRSLTVDLFASAAASLGGPLVYCPASEFLNVFVLDHSAAISALGIDTGMPARDVYARVTGKESSQAILASVASIRMPEDVALREARAPCILKPRTNVAHGQIFYPILCHTDAELADVAHRVDPVDYFVQRYVDGQSYYLCGYLRRNGAFAGYWQENLLQQPGGKSIVLARSCPNPGLDERTIFRAFAAAGYSGPLMVEFIREGKEFYYIETNPRFWGPLQLGLDCSHLAELYLEERFGVAAPPIPPMQYEVGRYYAWKFGARMSGLKVFPAGANLACTEKLLDDYDVYGAADARALHGKG